MSETPPAPSLNLEPVAIGESLYRQRRASCHGADLAGDPDWKTPNPDGSYPRPHDSSGHTWHHPDQLLVEIVRNGSGCAESRMPLFADLGTEQVLAILEHLKSGWGHRCAAFQWEGPGRRRSSTTEPTVPAVIAIGPRRPGSFGPVHPTRGWGSIGLEVMSDVV